MKTTVVNFFGGPGTGKSTLACDLFGLLKRHGTNVELVREYVKEWAWEGRRIKPFDQFYITAKQFRRESLLYNKVEYVITDSPILIGPFYEFYYNETDIVLPSVRSLIEHLKSYNVEHKNFFIQRNKPYVQEGRYESENEARNIDKHMRAYLDTLGIKYYYINDREDTEKPKTVYEILCHEK